MICIRHMSGQVTELRDHVEVEPKTIESRPLSHDIVEEFLNLYPRLRPRVFIKE